MIRSWAFVALGLVLAALAAGISVGLEFAAFGWIAGVVEGSPSEDIVSYGVLAAMVAAPVFFVGLVFPGIPIWLWLHGIGQRSSLAAALAVAIGASGAGVILTAPFSGWVSVVMIGWLAAPGAIAGLVLRRIAYRPVRPPRPSPARPS